MNQRARDERGWLVPAAAAAVGMALVAYFDFFAASSAISTNDDWGYSWSVRELALGHGFRVLHDYGVLHLPQTLVAFVLTLGNYDNRLLRLTVLPFVFSTCVAVYFLSRRMGATRFWSAVAAAVPLTMPIQLSVATGFMTEFFFIGLLLPAIFFAHLWVTERRGVAACLLLAMLATLERPTGVFLAPALTAALAWPGGRRPLSRVDILGLIGLLVAAPVEVLLPFLLGFSSTLVASTHQVQGVAGTNPSFLVVPIAAVPGMIVAIAAPLVLAVCGWRPGRLREARLRPIVVLPGMAVWVVLTALASQSVASSWTRAGIGPALLSGEKPWVAVVTVGFAAVFLVTATLPVTWWWRSRPLSAAQHPPSAALPTATQGAFHRTAVVLLIVGGGQVLAMVQSGAFDRYYVAAIIPVLPLLGAVASRASKRNSDRLWAVVCLAFGLVIFASGEQDYLAWQTAREAAASLAYRTVSPLRVDAGYEANAVHAVLPYFDEHGSYPRRLSAGSDPRDQMIQFLLHGPDNPAFTLCFGPSRTRGEGVSYSSLAPGRILVQPGARCGL